VRGIVARGIGVWLDWSTGQIGYLQGHDTNLRPGNCLSWSSEPGAATVRLG
jgi:hypothetical protein